MEDDFLVEHKGTKVLLQGASNRGKEWMKKNYGSNEHLIERDHVRNFVRAIIHEGLQVKAVLVS